MLLDLPVLPARMTGHAGVTVQGLSKAFGSTVAVDDPSLSVEPGEIVGLVGPNGAGKTTTISSIGGLLRPDRGVVRICGEDALRRGQRTRRHLGIAAQRARHRPARDAAWVRAIAPVSPVYWMLHGFDVVIGGRPGTAALLAAPGMLFVFATAAAVVTAWRYRFDARKSYFA